jgi:hypothetical protein
MNTLLKIATVLLGLLCCASGAILAAEPVERSGIYPHLAMFNNEGECGTGAVVPWADRLWVITYGPHLPNGSSDKLYEILPNLEQVIRPESVGGTPANRMLHRESNQLFIGPYVIDAKRHVRVIPPQKMFGRLTGNARHLTDPANKIYYATMEEGFYEVDVKTLAVKELYQDGNRQKDHGGKLLPGYHGKGLYSSQGRLIYANNGENSGEARQRPDIPSGVLAEWNGTDWKVVRRNQFCEVTGPGGIAGNATGNEPVWSIGWDHRSLILMLLDQNQWHTFRLPKGSHSYDGAHGWNTEWPRIREIGEDSLLMTMHGTFWKFPKTFSAANTSGIVPRSNYLKVIGDFCRWNDRLVFGCDDAAKSEFLNKRKVKGEVAGPGKSQSNLWFVKPEQLNQLGPALGRGAVWLNDAVKAGEPSDPFLLSGYAKRGVYLRHREAEPVVFHFEIDRQGNGTWDPFLDVKVPAEGAVWQELAADVKGEWIRVRTNRNAAKTTVFYNYQSLDTRTAESAPMFTGLTKSCEEASSGGIIRARGDAGQKLEFAAAVLRAGKIASQAFYELDAELKLQRVENASAQATLQKNAAVPKEVITIEEASVLVVDGRGRRYRLPKGSAAAEQAGPLPLRVAREVCTERDLFQASGSFYELPAENAEGFARIRPVATHNSRVTDFCSWRGLLVMSGVAANAPEANKHIIRSDDQQVALWVGGVDDLWKLGKPRGQGGPWKNSAVKANVPSDAYLLTGYDQKQIALSHAADQTVNVRVELDISGVGDWQPWKTIAVPAGKTINEMFPAAMSAYWLRLVADQDCQATAWLTYE